MLKSKANILEICHINVIFLFFFDWKLGLALTGLDSASCSQGLTLWFVQMRGKLLIFGTHVERIREIQLADYKKYNWEREKYSWQEIQLTDWGKYRWQITRNTIYRVGEIQLSYFKKYNWQRVRDAVCRFWEIQLTEWEKYSCHISGNTIDRVGEIQLTDFEK